MSKSKKTKTTASQQLPERSPKPKRPRSEFLRLPEPCYVFASNLYWSQCLSGQVPHTSADYLALLDQSNPLRFRLLGRGRHYQAVRTLNEVLDDAQYLQRAQNGHTGLQDDEIKRLRSALLRLDGSEEMVSSRYYIGAVLYRERKSRDELIIAFGNLDRADTCFTIRISELPISLDFRFMITNRLKGEPASVDFCLSPHRRDIKRLYCHIEEYYRIGPDTAVNPWRIRDGVAVPDPCRHSDHRSIPFSRGYLAKSGDWVIHTSYGASILYESATIF